MKKIFTVLFTMALFSLGAFAIDKDDVMAKFDAYVKDANEYSSALPDYYIKNAKIIRVVNKKGGGQKWVIIPFDRYVKELTGHSILAKAVGYKNRYENRKISKVGNDYKISSTRIPRNDKTGLPAHFVFTKQDGVWKIKEESMTTNVQAFLNAK